MKFLLSFSIFFLFPITSFAEVSPEVKAEFERATRELKASGIEKKALGKDIKVPIFNVGDKTIRQYFKQKPLIIKFYRGHWCPYCIRELKEYQANLDELEKYGNIIALVPDLEKEIKKTRRDHGIKFPIFRDEEQRIASLFGLVFKVDEKVLKLYGNFGIDLEKSQGSSKGVLPMPGTYIVDSNGMITYAFVDADYTKRAPVSEVLAALKATANK